MPDIAATRKQVVDCASQEALQQINWKANEPRILEYFLRSTNVAFTKQQAQEISWCSYFVHWVLLQCGTGSGVAVGDAGHLPKVHDSMGNEHRVTSIGRFMNDQGGPYQPHSVTSGYVPQPGDMYYVPKTKKLILDPVTKKQVEKWSVVHHIGIIVKVSSDGSVWTADGNSGERNGRGPYDLSLTTYTDRMDKTGPVIINGVQAKDAHNKIGYGYVYSPPDPRKIEPLPDNQFIELSV